MSKILRPITNVYGFISFIVNKTGEDSVECGSSSHEERVEEKAHHKPTDSECVDQMTDAEPTDGEKTDGDKTSGQTTGGETQNFFQIS